MITPPSRPVLRGLVDVVAWHLPIPEEEQHVVEKYGAAYEDYLRQATRWIGFLWTPSSERFTDERSKHRSRE